jgi:hypothetical protein
MNTVAGIIQARMGSHRLPGKSMAKVYEDYGLLEMVILRVMKAKKLDIDIDEDLAMMQTFLFFISVGKCTLLDCKRDYIQCAKSNRNVISAVCEFSLFVIEAFP